MTNNYIDYKVELWNRVYFEEDAEMEKFIEAHNSEQEMEEPFDAVGEEYLYETEDFVPLEANDFNSTVEIYQKGQMIWKNGK